MRPTFSIICFTVLSGLGYGAWLLIGLALALGPLCDPPAPPGAGLFALKHTAPFLSSFGYFGAFAFVVAGLLASLGHLGKPQRAWRALAQWRSSWLSREGVAALLTFLPAAALALLLWRTEFTHHAVGAPCPDAATLRSLGLLLAIGACATVFCTAHIYSSLRPIRAWSERHVVPTYHLLAVYGGGLLLGAAGTIDGLPSRDRQLLLVGTIVLAVAGFWLKRRYWLSIDAQPTTSAGHATGLESLGHVHSLEQPHTEENYLTHEMGFVLARRHSRKLRRIALVAAFLIPTLLAALGLAVPVAQPLSAWLALLSGGLGLLIERWLFFAEARHTVMAYYAR